MLLGIALAVLRRAFLLSRFLLTAREQHRQAASALDTTETSLLESEQRFRQMADNIQEIFWMIDAETRKTLYVNPAYETITGRSAKHSKKTRSPTKRSSILMTACRCSFKLDEATRTGNLDERFRIVLPGGDPRWFGCADFPFWDGKAESVSWSEQRWT